MKLRQRKFWTVLSSSANFLVAVITQDFPFKRHQNTVIYSFVCKGRVFQMSPLTLHKQKCKLMGGFCSQVTLFPLKVGFPSGSKRTEKPLVLPFRASCPPAERRTSTCVRGLWTKSGGTGNQPRLGPTGQTGLMLDFHIFKHSREQKKVCDDADLLPAATDAGAAWQQYRGGSRPNTNRKWLYGCYRRICT